MGSIHKDARGRSKYWYAAYADETGRRRFVSTEQTDRDKALDFLLTTERAVAAAKTGRLTRAKAEQIIGSLLERTTGEQLVSHTIRNYCTLWIASREADDLAPSTASLYRKVVRVFLETLGPKADMDLRTLNAEDIERVQGRLIADGLSASSVDKELRVVRSITKRAHDYGLIPSDPAKAVVSIAKRKGKGRAEKVVRGAFSDAELDMLDKRCVGDWKTVFRLARYTGARLGDCQRMRWSSVDLQKRIITFSDEKTRKRIVIPIHERLHDHILTLPGSDDPSAYLAPDLALKPSGGTGGTSLAFRGLMRAAGVDDDVTDTHSVNKKASKGRTLARRSFHSIRHSFNSALANGGVPQDLRQKLVGHSSGQVNAGYTHYEMDLFRSAISKLK